MGWTKRKEPITTQPAHNSLAEMTRAMPASEPELVESDPVAAATIGATMHIQGELTGHEDITIEGSLEGRVELLEHTLTVGASANIKASLRARCIVIEGQVVGDVTADDKVEITATGSLVGDIRAARVVLAEDARFKGSIDMGWSESDAEPAERAAPARPPVREERASPAPAPRAAAPAARGSLSSLDWNEPAPPPPPQFSPKD